jgi:tRNA(Arg) A34 adenosine deaminase TadA
MVEVESSGTGSAQPARHPTAISFTLPAWVSEELEGLGPLADDQARMGLVLALARANVVRSGGGPFAAAVFSRDGGGLIAVGVNLVIPSSAPIAHAEIIAIALSGARLGSHDLGVAGPTELVSSCQPCAMCLGAVPWSGVSRVVCGARDDDARAVGFDEGDKPGDWAAGLRARGIEVVEDVRRDEAAEVLRAYALAGGPIYNGTARRS